MKIRKWLPVINTSLCNGCQRCVLACGPKCLEILDGVAVLTDPNQCGSEEHCIAPCPIKAIEMDWVECYGNLNIGKWDIKLRCQKGASLR